LRLLLFSTVMFRTFFRKRSIVRGRQVVVLDEAYKDAVPLWL